MKPNCPHCKSTEYTAVSRTSGGAKLLLVICKNCEAILAAVRE
jgi:transcription elongation factor Elf1